MTYKTLGLTFAELQNMLHGAALNNHSDSEFKTHPAVIWLILVKLSVYASHQQNVGWNHSKKKANKSFGNVEKFKYLGVTLTYKNWQGKKWEQIKFRKYLLPFYLEGLCFPIFCLKT